MAAQLRVLRRRIRSVQSTKKITRAMELIATSRIGRAQARVEAARPYAEEITNVLTSLATAASRLDSPLLTERDNPTRAAVLVVTSDRGLCGAYNANVLRITEELLSLLRDEGKTPQIYVIGSKGVNYFRFRNREIRRYWTGFSEQPGYDNAATVGDAMVASFLHGEDDQPGGDGQLTPGPDEVVGVDELHVVFTEFVSMLTQRPIARRAAPLEVEYAGEGGDGSGAGAQQPAGPGALYEFEPDAEILLGRLLPTYINTRIFAALLEAAASESAARRQAMKAATDNANDVIDNLSREANQARQGQITQEISEIVGGAEALATVGSDE